MVAGLFMRYTIVLKLRNYVHTSNQYPKNASRHHAASSTTSSSQIAPGFTTANARKSPPRRDTD